jgi:exonuclease SbcD
MIILHTSDWHLGRSFYGRKRYDEFSAFLDWLARTIEDKEIDALLVAGDLFDTNTQAIVRRHFIVALNLKRQKLLPGKS